MLSLSKTGFRNFQYKYIGRTFYLTKTFHDKTCLCLKNNLFNTKHSDTRLSKLGEKVNIHIEHVMQYLNTRQNLRPIITTIEICSYSPNVRTRFKSSVCINVNSTKVLRSSGPGSTRKLAEQAAVNNLIQQFNWLNICKPIEDDIDILNPYKGYKVPNHGKLPPDLPSYLYNQNSKFLSAKSPIVSFKRDFSSLSSEAGVRQVRSTADEVTQNSPAGGDYDYLYKEILKAYPAPRNRLHNFFEHVRTSQGESTSPLLHHSTKKNNQQWVWTIQADWPEKGVFEGVAGTKKEASKKAALQCLKWLKDLGKIDLNGNIRIVEESVIRKQKRVPLAQITLKTEFINETESIIETFNREFESKLGDLALLWDTDDMPSFTEVNSNFDQTVSSSLMDMRNKELCEMLEHRNSRISPGKLVLPITDYRQNISELIRNNSVVVIKGEPGCGKSTQVPQFIFDEWTEQMKGTECNIVVTQPRRISAISLAERIAYERNEELGNVVGYQVRFDSVFPAYENGRILFCTTGIMLRKLLSSNGMKGISHLIIDEAHERDLNTDFLLLLAKRAIMKYPDLRVVIMSATINAELFQSYYNNAPAVHIPGFTFPVTSTFLDVNMAQTIGQRDKRKGKSDGDMPEIDPLAVSRMVTWVDQNRPPGAILVFLPGWDVIRKVREALEDNYRLYVVPVHSRLSHYDQRKIFHRPPEGKRKVVLATNIAETSITINDINYVIDSGAHKEKRLHSMQGISCIDNHWVSQASVRQRMGRAGRVQPGECYHLYSKEKFDSFDEFPLPEVHRIRLEMSVLQSKTYSGNEKAEEFLSQLPEPPSIAVIREAVEKLQFIGALDDSESLTALGRRISVFTTHPFLSKALVLSYIFRCVNPMLTIGTLLSSDIELFPGLIADKIHIRNGKRKFSPSSDHLALAWLYHQWDNYLSEDEFKARRLLEDMMASHDAFGFIKRLRNLVGGHFRQCKIMSDTDEHSDQYSECNRYSENDELIKGVLLSGIGNVLTARNWDLRKGVLRKSVALLTETGHRAIFTSDSVNYKRTEFPSPIITYFQEVHSMQLRVATIRDSSLLSPLTMILFHPGYVTMSNQGENVLLQVKSRKYHHFLCDERTATTLIKFREVIWSLVDFFVREEGNQQDIELYNKVSNFHARTLELLNRILLDVGTSIDYDETGQLRNNV